MIVPVACVCFPHFCMRGSVADCPEKAPAQGVRKGMSSRIAFNRCPDALFLTFSDRYKRACEDSLISPLRPPWVSPTCT